MSAIWHGWLQASFQMLLATTFRWWLDVLINSQEPASAGLPDFQGLQPIFWHTEAPPEGGTEQHRERPAEAG